MSSHELNPPMLQARELFKRPGPIPEFRLEGLVQAKRSTLVARSPSSTDSASDSTTSCGPKDTTGPCERMVSASSNVTTLPIVLGVVIPLVVAFVVLIVLHRRHMRKLRQEDAEDKHKSLDFGMGRSGNKEKRGRKGGKAVPEMSAIDAQHTVRRDRGLSMDMTMGNPYLLPPELQKSRESLHSLSRSLNTGDDKYRATNFIPDDGSIHSPSSLRGRDDASIYTSSSRHRTDTESTKGLLPNDLNTRNEPVPIIKKPIAPTQDNSTSLLAPAALDTTRDSYMSTTSSNGNMAALRASNNYLAAYISGGGKKEKSGETKVAVAELAGDAPHEELREPPNALLKDRLNKRNSVAPGALGFNFDIPPNTYELSSGPEPTLPKFDVTPADDITPEIHEAPGHEVQREVFSANSNARVSKENSPYLATQQQVNPSIQVDHSEYDNESDYYDEEEQGEQGGQGGQGEQYNINDYKEVLGYDPRLLTMGMRPLPPDDPTENPEERALRIRSFYKEYFDDTAKPGGEKARVSYFDGSENYIDDYYGSYAQSSHGSRGPSTMSARGPPGRHRATISNGSYVSGRPGPRAYSSASQQLPGNRVRQLPKKRLPPPQPLHALPTPYKLKDDAMLPNPMDFAPPEVFKNQRAGTPDALKGGLRPYSPGTRAYNPLVSSFDDLSVLPSPHLLRKSGTFTSLDFAPPRFAAQPSDTGSIRSNRSNMSAMQLHHIRAGAYRISRIPKEVAGTRDELAEALRPQWNAR